jgi:hypothetical protein
MQARALGAFGTATQKQHEIVNKMLLVVNKLAGEITEENAGKGFDKCQKEIDEIQEGVATLYAAFCCEMGYMTYKHYVDHFIQAQSLETHLQLKGLFTSNTAFLEDNDMSTTPVLMTLQQKIREDEKKKIIDHEEKMQVEQLLREIQELMRACFEMGGSRMDPVVANILLWGIVFQSFFFPFSICASYKWYGLPVMLILTYIYTGLYYCSILMSQPFGGQKTGYAVSYMSNAALAQNTNINLLASGIGLEREMNFVDAMLAYQDKIARFGEDSPQSTFKFKVMEQNRWHSRGRFQQAHIQHAASSIFSCSHNW